MSDDPEKKSAVVVRDAHGRIQSGALNPGGRPKALAEVVRAARDHTQKAIDTLVSCLSDEDGRVRVSAAVALLDRGWGKAPQTVLLDEGHSSSPNKVDLNQLSDEALKAYEVLLLEMKRIRGQEPHE